MSLIYYRIDLLESSLKKHGGFDLFIQSTSAEERSFRAAGIIRNIGCEVDKTMVFSFNEVMSAIGTRKSSFLANYSLGNDKMSLFECNLLDVENGIKAFYESCKSKNILTEKKRILVDISTFIKPYFYCLLKLLSQECRITEICVTYTEPASYGKPFTRGLDHVGEIPSFNGFADINKKNMLVIMLGFEGHRALEVLRSVQPDKTLTMNGFPGYRSEFKDVSLISNINVIREGECLPEMRFSSANDPFETYRSIENLYDAWSTSYNFSVAPLGSKPMALGACLFALQHTDTRILYAYPQGYMQKVAEKYGKTWMYEIFFE